MVEQIQYDLFRLPPYLILDVDSLRCDSRTLGKMIQVIRRKIKFKFVTDGKIVVYMYFGGQSGEDNLIL
jgi:hypothetical protein